MIPPAARARRCASLRAGAWAWVFLALLPVAARCLAAGAQADQTPPPTLLTNIQQVIELGKLALQTNSHPVHLRGVVTGVSPESQRLYLQDGQFSISAQVRESIADRTVGDLVEVQGVASPALQVPRVTVEQLKVVGTAPLPRPKRGDVYKMVQGEDATRYMIIRGVVRDLIWEDNHLVHLIRHGSLHFRAYAPAPPGTPLPRTLIDAEVDIRGVCRPGVDMYGRPAGFDLLMPSPTHYRLIRPGTSNLFERPLSTIAELHNRQPADIYMRTRIAGTVLVHVPNYLLILQDDTGAASIHLVPLLSRATGGTVGLEHEPQSQLQPGERVEVIAVRHDDRSPRTYLYDGEFRRIGRAATPPPTPVSVKQLRAGTHAHRMVTVTGRILANRIYGLPGSLQHIWMLDADGEVIQARFDGAELPGWTFKPREWVRVTGVQEFYADHTPESTELIIRMRGHGDFIAAGPPPIWNRREYRTALAVGASVGVVALAIFLLQRWQLLRLRTSEERFRALVDNSFDATVVLDADGGLKYMSPSWARLLGTKVHSPGFMKSGISEVIHPDDLPLIVEAHRDVLKNPGKSRRVTGYRILAADGSVRYADAIGTNCLHVRGVEGVVVNIRDITESFRAEDELRQLNLELEQRVRERTRELEVAKEELHRALDQERELSELKSRFVSMVSHEFRTPLGIIMSSAEILDAYLDRLPPEERRSNLRDIFESTRHMADLMEEVLLLGRFEAGKINCRRAPLELAAFCRRVVDEVSSATHGRCPIEFQVPPDLPPATADEGLLRHLLTNLLNNGVKYSPAGSPVELTVAARDGSATFTISDQGIGIPEADARHLFQAFHRATNVGDRPGSGLGLTIVKRCVELHGGRISFESREGQGSTFTVDLPLFAPAPVPQASP